MSYRNFSGRSRGWGSRKCCVSYLQFFRLWEAFWGFLCNRKQYFHFSRSTFNTTSEGFLDFGNMWGYVALGKWEGGVVWRGGVASGAFALGHIVGQVCYWNIFWYSFRFTFEITFGSDHIYNSSLILISRVQYVRKVEGSVYWVAIWNVLRVWLPSISFFYSKECESGFSPFYPSLLTTNSSFLWTTDSIIDTPFLQQIFIQ